MLRGDNLAGCVFCTNGSVSRPFMQSELAIFDVLYERQRDHPRAVNPEHWMRRVKLHRPAEHMEDDETVSQG